MFPFYSLMIYHGKQLFRCHRSRSRVTTSPRCIGLIRFYCILCLIDVAPVYQIKMRSHHVYFPLRPLGITSKALPPNWDTVSCLDENCALFLGPAAVTCVGQGSHDNQPTRFVSSGLFYKIQQQAFHNKQISRENNRHGGIPNSI